MQLWKIIGTVSTLIIALTLPFYAYQELQKRENQPHQPQPARFAGSESCEKCHHKEYKEWQQSHHAKAMAVATKETVLGDFNNTLFIKDGIESRFYKKGDAFFVHTQGPDGKMDDFQIRYTFGYAPLQQYLVAFPGGRMQCLPIAWDVQTKQWFHLYPELTLDPEEWIYWTNQGQNWNSMCADCHSTNLKKNYNPGTDSYTTTWSEISVGCEACHGPGSDHLAWAALPEAARREPGKGLTVQTSQITHQQQVELCAPCHSRRSMLGDYTHQQQELLDTMVPRLLESGLYYNDGQILDEVYVYASFLQSKMYANGVRCSDCHNPHTGTLHQQGNDLCLQCHQAAVYDSKTHHFHKYDNEPGEAITDKDGNLLFAVGTGSQCVQCHMPGRFYMGNDYRPDHSIRIPRPDLSVQLGTPNGCNRCHFDKDDNWSLTHTRKWYGTKEKYHFGTTFTKGREGDPLVLKDLLQICNDSLSPVIVRATALSLLSRYPETETTPIFLQFLGSEYPLLRRTAVAYFPGNQLLPHFQNIIPLLSDPVKAVRLETARLLTAIPREQIDKPWHDLLDKVLAEYEATALYSADFAASRLNLGALHSYRNSYATAKEHLLKAIEIDRDVHSARLNLAVLYSREGNSKLAEQTLREAIALNNELADAHYSLGLLLSEQKQYGEAVFHLQKGADGMGVNSRAYYNLSQLLDFLRYSERAEKALQKCLELEPENMHYLQAMASFYVKNRDLEKAETIARQIIQLEPSSEFGAGLLKFIERTRAGQ